VEQTLEGRSEALKERLIGIEVFGRAADYDTNTDHVVRSVAGEVRRRLAQYYIEAGHDEEIRIDLVPGSYVPQFRLAAAPPPAEPVIALHAEAPPAVPNKRLHWRPALIVAAVLVAVAAVAAFAIPLTGTKTAFDRFWGPVFASPNPVLLCFGGGQADATPAANEIQTVRDFERQPFRRMHTSDALALVDLAGMLQSNRRPYRILNRASSTSFRELQSGPYILIGGMNNEWTLRLTSTFRFGFEKLENGARVVDRQTPSNTAWTFDFTTPLPQLNRDYAIVSRVRDQKTEQTAVVAAGIGSWGTLAAGEFVTNPEHLKKLDALAPPHWENKNLEVVIATDVIRASSGPPTVLSSHFW
jgi:hypothetical protein